MGASISVPPGAFSRVTGLPAPLRHNIPESKDACGVSENLVENEVPTGKRPRVCGRFLVRWVCSQTAGQGRVSRFWKVFAVVPGVSLPTIQVTILKTRMFSQDRISRLFILQREFSAPLVRHTYQPFPAQHDHCLHPILKSTVRDERCMAKNILNPTYVSYKGTVKEKRTPNDRENGRNAEQGCAGSEAGGWSWCGKSLLVPVTVLSAGDTHAPCALSRLGLLLGSPVAGRAAVSGSHTAAHLP